MTFPDGRMSLGRSGSLLARTMRRKRAYDLSYRTPDARNALGVSPLGGESTLPKLRPKVLEVKFDLGKFERVTGNGRPLVGSAKAKPDKFPSLDMREVNGPPLPDIPNAIARVEAGVFRQLLIAH